jgi:hypothetical protein
VLRELSGVLRRGKENHAVNVVGTDDDIQSTIRLYPDAFLAASVLVCEGASEIGFVRGVDLHRVESGGTAMTAQGVALVDCGGGEPERAFKRAAVFLALGYRAAILRDGDTEVEERAGRIRGGGGRHCNFLADQPCHRGWRMNCS